MAIAAWFADGSNLVSVGALVTSTLALTRTWSTSRTAKRNLHIAMKQDARKYVEPQAQLLQSKRKVLDDAERYSYLIHIRNPADVGHFIVRAELAIDYRSRAGIAATVKIPGERTVREEVSYLGAGPALEMPVNIAARQVVEGWMHFRFPKSLMSDHYIDRFVILLEAGDGGTLSMESIIPSDV